MHRILYLQGDLENARKMPWLAILLLFAPYLSNFKLNFDASKNKVGLPNQYNLINYLRYAHDLLDMP